MWQSNVVCVTFELLANVGFHKASLQSQLAPSMNSFPLSSFSYVDKDDIWCCIVTLFYGAFIQSALHVCARRLVVPDRKGQKLQ